MWLTRRMAEPMALQPISPIADILITGVDLPFDDDLYLTKISKQKFREHFGETDETLSCLVLGGSLLRIYITLPLEIDDENVIPLPFIVDTGAPGHLFLGHGAKSALQRKGISVTERYNARKASYIKCLNGRLFYGNKYTNNPTVNDLPSNWTRAQDENQEQGVRINDIWEDVRANILGLDMLCELNIILNPNKLLQDTLAQT